MRVSADLVGRMCRVGGIALVPQIVTSAVRFTEADERHVPRHLSEQPPRRLALPAGTRHQLVPKPGGFRYGEHFQVLGRRIPAEPPQQLTTDSSGSRSWLREPGPGAVLEDLGAAKTHQGVVHERVHDHALSSGVVEQLPERRQRTPFGARSLHPLRSGSDLIRVVETMMARRGSGGDRRPRRDVHHIGGGSEASPRASSTERGESGQVAVFHPCFDQLRVGAVECEDEHTRHATLPSV